MASLYSKTQFNNSKRPPEESVEELLNSLQDIYSKDEIERIRSVFLQLKARSKVKAKLIRPIVPIRQWLNDYYYVGSSVNILYDYWKDAIIEIFESPTRINQVILTGAMGVGKTTTAVLIILRVIYELSCYENVASLFNLAPISRIAFAYLSVTKDQAMMSGFAKMIEWVDDIPYFKEHFQRKQGLDSMLVWPNERLFVTVGSNHNHFIGLDMIGAILDEANFREMAGTRDNEYNVNKKVLTLYTQMITRSQTRFIVNGVNYSLAILVSSTTHVGSFTEEIIKKSQNDPATKIFSPAIWDVKPQEYGDKRFLVYAGGNNLEPFVINTLEDLEIVLKAFNKEPIYDTPIEDVYDILPTDVKQFIIKVPQEHKTVFDLNITEGLQSLAGYSVASISKFFRNYAAYQKAISGNLRHPFIKDEIVLSNTTNSFEDGYQPLSFYMDPSFKFSNPRAKHVMHLDLALTGDSVGMALGHISDWKPIYTKERTEHQIKYGEEPEYTATLPIVTIDFMLRINPPKKPHKISLPKIRDFIIYLKRERGINIELVTADQFQSAQILQELEEFGIKTANLSVDRTAEPYFALSNLYDEGRIKTYQYDKYEDELFNLIFYTGAKKIDHPATMPSRNGKGEVKGSKDVSDAVAGTVYNLVKQTGKGAGTQQDLLANFIKFNNNKKSKDNDIANAIKNLTDMLTRG